MKEIKPYIVLVFIAGVLLLLTPIMILAPEDGWNLGALKVNFLTQENFYNPKKQEKTDITNIIAAIDTTMLDVEPDPLIKHTDGSNGDLGAPNGGDVSVEASTDLLMNEDGTANIHSFFKTLRSVANSKEKISILHYGDSQIEGDRMTSYIRQKIQNQFGGNGPGLIPATNVYNTFTFKQSYSENFVRYTSLAVKN